MVYDIPDFIVEFYNKTLSANGVPNVLKIKQFQNKEITDWFASIPYSRKTIFSLLKRNQKTFEVFRCSVCGKELSEAQIQRGSSFCSHKCSNSTEEFKEKQKKTNLERYGCAYPCQNEEINKKRENTNKENYGVANPCECKEINEKRITTNKEKYGVENPSQSNLCKEKTIATNLERYGVKNVTNSEVVRKKMMEEYGSEYFIASSTARKKSKDTLLNRLGVENPMHSEIVQKKAQETKLSIYGDEFYSNREKAKETCLERYGVENPNQSKEIQEKRYKTHKKRYFETLCNLLESKNIQLLSNKDEFVNTDSYRFKCLRCCTEFKDNISNPQRIWCPSCAEKQGTSLKELDVINYIKSLCDETTEIITNDRKVLDGKELDVYIPSKSLAFEFDGNFWHSELYKEKHFHQEKTLLCREKGIRLIHIFEYEWDNNRHKLEGLIKSALGIFEKTIYARECECREVSSFDYNAFLDLNHLQGKVNSSIRYGLYYDGELVSVIGFGKSRFKGGEFELYRFCNKLGYRIIGGFSKLIKHSNVKEFVSYVDLAHFSGKGYESVGFKELSVTEPNYVYVKNNSVITRISAQKHKLKDLLKEGYDENLSESDNMAKNNWLKVYDCGNLKMKYFA